MSIMFEPVSIKAISLKNRIARSATYEGMATFDGRPKPELAEVYYALADGEVGLVFTSASMVEGYEGVPAKPGHVYATAIDHDRYVDDWRPIVEGVKARGAAIVMQIVHPGRQDNPKLRGGYVPAPSVVQPPGMKLKLREMTTDEISETIEKFVQAIRRIKDAGFDGAQLHGGHGYLVNNFLSPYMNRRQDDWGGSPRNRARFVNRIVARARELVGEFPIMIKMNCDDFVNSGIDVSDAVELARAITGPDGVDCIEVTGGIGIESMLHISRGGIKTPDKEAYFKEYAVALKAVIDVPVILVGGLRSPAVIEAVLADGHADLVSISRPFIREPGLVKRWKDGDRERATCVSCNQCGLNTFRNPMKCYLEK